MSKYQIQFDNFVASEPVSLVLYPDDCTAEIIIEDGDAKHTLLLLTQPEWDSWGINDLKLNLMNMDGTYLIRMQAGGVDVGTYVPPFNTIEDLLDYAKSTAGLEVSE